MNADDCPILSADRLLQAFTLSVCCVLCARGLSQQSRDAGPHADPLRIRGVWGTRQGMLARGRWPNGCMDCYKEWWAVTWATCRPLMHPGYLGHKSIQCFDDFSFHLHKIEHFNLITNQSHVSQSPVPSHLKAPSWGLKAVLSLCPCHGIIQAVAARPC